jgi:uncharacterized protein
MRIYEFVWPQERIDHIAEHGVTPEEVEEVCFGKPLVLRAKSDGVGYPVSARPMTTKEKRRYQSWKNR